MGIRTCPVRWRSALGVYGMFLGPEGVVAAALLTWSLVIFASEKDLWQLTFIFPQCLTMILAISQARSGPFPDDEPYPYYLADMEEAEHLVRTEDDLSTAM